MSTALDDSSITFPAEHGPVPPAYYFILPIASCFLSTGLLFIFVNTKGNKDMSYID